MEIRQVRSWGPTALGAAAAATASLAAGIAVARTPPFFSLSLIFGGALLGWVVAGGPVRALTVIAALAAFGWSPSGPSLGEVDIRILDFAYILLIGLVLVVPQPRRRAPRVPTWPIVLLLGYVGISLAVVASTQRELLVASSVSWTRLLQTFSLIWLTRHVLRSPDDAARLIRGFMAGGAGAIVIAAWQTPWGDVFSQRVGGLLNANTLGLLSGVLIVLALFSGVPRARTISVGIIALSLLGLMLAKSVAALVALTLALGLGAARIGMSGWPRRIRGAVVMITAALFALAFLRVARPELRPSTFRETSVGERIVLGTAGWELFLSHPVLGVGWHASATRLGDPEIASTVRERLPGFGFSPGGRESTSTHNAYLQVLAELGLVGAGLAVFAVLAYVSGFRRLRQSELRTATGLVLMTVLIWWNDNPLFGGQVESLTFALFLGLGSFLSLLPGSPPDS